MLIESKSDNINFVELTSIGLMNNNNLTKHLSTTKMCLVNEILYVCMIKDIMLLITRKSNYTILKAL